MLVNKRQGIVLGGRWLGAHALGHRSVSSCDFLSILPAHCEVDCSVQPWSPFHRKPTSLRLCAKINSSYKLFISDGLATVTKVNDDIIFCFFIFVLSITTIISSMKNVGEDSNSCPTPKYHTIYIRVLWKSSWPTHILNN